MLWIQRRQRVVLRPSAFARCFDGNLRQPFAQCRALPGFFAASERCCVEVRDHRFLRDQSE